MSGDLYPILADLESADAQIRSGAPFTMSLGGAAPESYTVFFIFSAGGQAAFHVTLKQLLSHRPESCDLAFWCVTV
jgi:hypothetical protein